MSCEYCDVPGGEKTYRNQVCLPLNGKVQCIDRFIHQIVAALNAGGVQTVASCCGHEKMPGRIGLRDGRVLTILPDEVNWCDMLTSNMHTRSLASSTPAP